MAADESQCGGLNSHQRSLTDYTERYALLHKWAQLFSVHMDHHGMTVELSQLGMRQLF
jgi:hypothetical protein